MQDTAGPPDKPDLPKLLRIIRRGRRAEERDQAWDLLLRWLHRFLQKRMAAKFSMAFDRLFDEFWSEFQARLPALLAQWKPGKGTVPAFLGTCADRLFIDMIRAERGTVTGLGTARENGSQSPEPAAPSPDPSEDLVKREGVWLSALRDVLRELPAERRVVWLVSQGIQLVDPEDRSIFERMTGRAYNDWRGTPESENASVQDLGRLFRVRANTLSQWNCRTLRSIREGLKKRGIRHGDEDLP